MEEQVIENRKITITLEEYKELLIIKGKYEELKSQQVRNEQVRNKEDKPILVREPKIMKDYELPKEPYKVTCSETKRLVQ